MVVLAQVDALLPTVLSGLGAALVICGLTIMAGARASAQVRRLNRWGQRVAGTTLPHERLVGGCLAAGILFVTVGAVQRYDLVVHFVSVFFLVSNVISGAAHVRTWQKITLALRRRGLQGDLGRTVRYGLLSTFVIVLAGSLLVYLLRVEPGGIGFARQLSLVWTVLTFGLSVVGLSKSVLPLQDRVDDRVLYGFVLTVAGTEVFDLTLPLYVGFLAVGAVGYGVGFWVAVYYWLVA